MNMPDHVARSIVIGKSTSTTLTLTGIYEYTPPATTLGSETIRLYKPLS
jgi:hypothetical protein